MTAERAGRGPLTWLLAALVRGYQLVVSPWLAPRCRYYPSCSAYGLEALRRHGAMTGLALAVWRVLRCNPWSAGGVDEVPDREHLPWRRAPRDASRQDCCPSTPAHGDGHGSADGPPSPSDRLAYGADIGSTRDFSTRVRHGGSDL